MWLRQSTASQEILLGRFLDSTDGNTEETGLTIANTDIKIWKEGATAQVNKNSGGATHDANGMYSAVLDATDSNTLGKIEVNVHVAGALSVRREFMVLPANVYDSFVLDTDTLLITLPTIPTDWITSSGILTGALNGKGNWNVGKTNYSILGTKNVLDDLNDIAATAVVSGGAINTTGGAVDTVTTLTNKTGFSLSTAGILAIWNQLTSALTTASTIGKLLVDNINATISSRMAETSINTTGGAVDNVTTVATTTTNTDMVAEAPTAIQNRQEMDANSVKLSKIPLSDGTITWNATALGSINAEADTALTDYDGPTNAEMEARTPTAAQLAYIVSNSADGLPVTFTGGTTTTAILGNVDGSAASSTDDVYNGRILIFNAGTLDQQATDITDYVGSTKTATITAVTTAVTGSHTANMK